MKKILYILLLISCSCFSQTNKIVTYNGKIVTYNGEIVTSSLSWPYRMAESYLSLNPHYDDYYALEVYNYLIQNFNSYPYYESTFGDSTTAGWFYVFKTSGNLVTTTCSNDKLFKWEIEGSFYDQINSPNHTTVSDSSFLLVCDSSGFSNTTSLNIISSNLVKFLPVMKTSIITSYAYNNNNGIINVPTIDAPEALAFLLRNNVIDGNVELVAPELTRFEIYNNGIDSLIMPENWMSPQLSTIYIHNNQLQNDDVNDLYDRVSIVLEDDNIIKNLAIWTHIGNAAPTCGDLNPDIIRLGNMYDSAGYTFSYNITASGTGALQQPTYMVTPDTMYILTDEPFEIYDECIAAMDIKDKNINIEYECSVGWKSFYGYKFDLTSSDIGFYSFKAIAKVCDTKIDSTECVIRVLDGGNGSGTKNFNVIGNSLTSNSGVSYIPPLRTGLTAITAVMNGTQGVAPNNHEGFSGYRVYDFISDYRLIQPIPRPNPMWIDGGYNYSLYRQTILELENPVDFVLIQLSINDILPFDTAWIDATLIPQIEEFIDSMINDGTGHIIMALSPKGENTGYGWVNNYGYSLPLARDKANNFVHNMQYLWDTLCGGFSGGRYADNVHISPQGLFIDRNNGYSKDGFYHTNALHPKASGYTQLSNSLRALIEGILKEDSE